MLLTQKNYVDTNKSYLFLNFWTFWTIKPLDLCSVCLNLRELASLFKRDIENRNKREKKNFYGFSCFLSLMIVCCALLSFGAITEEVFVQCNGTRLLLPFGAQSTNTIHQKKPQKAKKASTAPSEWWWKYETAHNKACDILTIHVMVVGQRYSCYRYSF